MRRWARVCGQARWGRDPLCELGSPPTRRGEAGTAPCFKRARVWFANSGGAEAAMTRGLGAGRYAPHARPNRPRRRCVHAARLLKGDHWLVRAVQHATSAGVGVSTTPIHSARNKGGNQHLAGGRATTALKGGAQRAGAGAQPTARRVGNEVKALRGLRGGRGRCHSLRPHRAAVAQTQQRPRRS